MKIVDWAKTALFVSLAIFFGFGSYAAWVMTQETKKISQQASTVLAQTSNSLQNLNTAVNQTSTSLSTAAKQLSSVSTGVNTALAAINRPCIPGPCGTLADVAKTLNTTRSAVGQVEVAANHEDKNLTTLDQQELTLFNNTNAAVSGLAGVETGINKSTTDLDALLTFPDLKKTITNGQTITYNLGQTTGDFQNKFHSFLYPPPCVGWKCHIKSYYEIFKTGVELSEPAYYFDQLIKGSN